MPHRQVSNDVDGCSPLNRWRDACLDRIASNWVPWVALGVSPGVEHTVHAGGLRRPKRKSARLPCPRQHRRPLTKHRALFLISGCQRERWISLCAVPVLGRQLQVPAKSLTPMAQSMATGRCRAGEKVTAGKTPSGMSREHEFPLG